MSNKVVSPPRSPSSSTIDDIPDEEAEELESQDLAEDQKLRRRKFKTTRVPMPPHNMPIVTHVAKLFYKRQAMFWFSVFVATFNFASVMIAILEYIRGSIDSQKDDMYVAANYCAIVGCVDVFLAIIFLLRNKWLQHKLFSQSFHHNTKYHIYFSIMASICFILHGMLMMILNEIDFSTDMTSKDTSGLNSWLTVFVIGASSMPSLRKSAFLQYHAIHWFLYLWLLIFASLHSPLVAAPLFAAATGFYLLDFFYFKKHAVDHPVFIKRAKFMRRYGILKLVVERPQNFTYEAGQFAYLCFPDLRGVGLGLLHWHPYSFSTTPKDKSKLTFYIRNVGRWSYAVCAMFDRYEKEKKKNKHLAPPALYMDGPCGQVMNIAATDQHHYDFKHVLFIAEGGGVMSAQSLFNDFLQHKIEKKADIKAVDFTWLCPEDDEVARGLLGQQTNSKSRSLSNDCSLDQTAYLHFQPNLLKGELITQFPQDAIKIQFYLENCVTLRLATVKNAAPTLPSPNFPQRPDYIDPVIRKPVDLEKLIRDAAQRVTRQRDRFLMIFVHGSEGLVKAVNICAKSFQQDDCCINVASENF